jgi:N-acetyl-anhydromuramyl-L-alanine amidase AmpD
MPDILSRIVLSQFPDDQYVKEETPKDTIYVHHTAGGASPFDVLEYWESTPERVATSFIIAGPPPKGVTAWTDGQIFQAYSSKYYAWHLGGQAMLYPNGKPAGAKGSLELNKKSIGIELCNWGPLHQTSDGRYLTVATGDIVNPARVLKLDTPYRGYLYWQAYSDAQLASLKDLIQYLVAKWNIPTTFKGMGMFDIDPRAQAGEPGIWTHTSVRTDKWDCSPQPKLVELLRTL